MTRSYKKFSLSEAIRTGRLEEFITQEERRDLAPADRKRFEATLKAAIKPHQSEDQTSGSRDPDSSTGK